MNLLVIGPHIPIEVARLLPGNVAQNLFVVFGRPTVTPEEKISLLSYRKRHGNFGLFELNVRAYPLDSETKSRFIF